MPGHARISRCPHKRTCCYFLRLEVGFANLIGQTAKLPSKTNSIDQFFKLRRVATAGVVALPAYLAAAVDRVRHAAMGLKSTGPREIFRLQQIRCSCFQNP